MKRQGPLIKLSDVIFDREERPILGPVSLQLGAGQSLAITGSNGSGKTTLLKILAKLLIPKTGDVYLAHNTHFMSHILPLDPRLTTQQNLDFLGGGHDEYGNVPILSLSQGQQKKLFLSYFTSCQDQKIWLMDEPFTHLDAEAITKLGDDIKQLLSKGGCVVFSHHGRLPIEVDAKLAL